MQAKIKTMNKINKKKMDKMGSTVSNTNMMQDEIQIWIYSENLGNNTNIEWILGRVGLYVL